MNYLHGFHAGNFADVVKHCVLTLILTYLKRKDTWFQVLDTHAGRGIYDLTGDQASRTGEADSGIFRLYDNRRIAAPIGLSDALEAIIAPYRAAIAGANPDGTLRFYPGSPLVVLSQLRAKDHLFASELHAREFAALQDVLSERRRVSLLHQDGYQCLNAVVPFTRKRGLVLMDPPYEAAQEFDNALAAIAQAVERFPAGIYALWYPLKSHHQAGQYARKLAKMRANMDLETVLRTEVFVRPGDNEDQLNGTGLAIFNPPYTLAGDLAQLLPELPAVLSQTISSARFQKVSVEQV